MKKDNNLPDIQKAVTIDYDAAGRLTNVQYPSGMSEGLRSPLLLGL